MGWVIAAVGYIILSVMTGGVTLEWTWWLLTAIWVIEPFTMTLLMICLPGSIVLTALLTSKEAGPNQSPVVIDTRRENPEPVRRRNKRVLESADPPPEQPKSAREQPKPAPERPKPTPVDLDAVQKAPVAPKLYVVKPIHTPTETKQPKIWGIDE